MQKNLKPTSILLAQNQQSRFNFLKNKRDNRRLKIHHQFLDAKETVNFKIFLTSRNQSSTKNLNPTLSQFLSLSLMKPSKKGQRMVQVQHRYDIASIHYNLTLLIQLLLMISHKVFVGKCPFHQLPFTYMCFHLQCSMNKACEECVVSGGHHQNHKKQRIKIKEFKSFYERMCSKEGEEGNFLGQDLMEQFQQGFNTFATSDKKDEMKYFSALINKGLLDYRIRFSSGKGLKSFFDRYENYRCHEFEKNKKNVQS